MKGNWWIACTVVFLVWVCLLLGATVIEEYVIHPERYTAVGK